MADTDGLRPSSSPDPVAPGPPGWRRLALRLRWLPSLLIIAVLVWVGVDRWSQLPSGERLPSRSALALAAGLHLVANALLAQGWRVQLALAGNKVDFGPAAAVWSSSQLSRFLLPGATFGARAVLAKRLDVAPAAAAATTVFELGMTLLAHPVVVLAALPWWDALPDALRWVGAASVVPAMVLAGLVLNPRRAIAAVAGTLRVVPGVRRRVPTPERLAEAELHPSDAAPLAGLHLGNVALRHVAFVVLVASTTPLDGAALAAVIGASALGRFVGLVAVFAPAGIGPREGMTVLALAPVIGATPAIVAVAATRVAEIVAEGGFWLLTRRSGER